MFSFSGSCFSRPVVGTVPVVFLCLLMTSCATGPTAAQRQLVQWQDNINAAQQKRDVCSQKVDDNPAYQSVLQHYPPYAGKATLVQLADSGVPSEEDVQAILSLGTMKRLGVVTSGSKKT
jgi:hypothetical protein